MVKKYLLHNYTAFIKIQRDIWVSMDTDDVSDLILSATKRYNIHILVFLFVLFVGLTFAHPAILINDEWITTNQLHQLHDGHQIVVNEGKYGLYENGTMTAYFAARGNKLVYSLFLPLISLPSLWMIDLLGDHFVFFILYLWTIVAFMFILFLHFFFRKFTSIGKWCWTPAALGIIFIIFFINLFNYNPFPLSGTDSHAEVMAVVFTNIILLALVGTLIYEINQTLFADPSFSLFGTVVCLSSSSYFFWATGGKDHILVLLLFAGVLLSLVKFQKTKERWYLPLAFLFSGLLAWARPELALWVFFAVCLILGYTLFRKRQNGSVPEYFFLTCSPLFTLLGALPFFLNNYLITKNPLLPMLAVSNSPQLNTILTSTVLEDLVGIFFHPLNRSMGIFSLTPLFLVMTILGVVLVLSGKLHFSWEENHMIAVIALLAFSVFLAYAGRFHMMYVDVGINPDIRLLSPVYVPLTLLGLVILRRAQVIAENPLDTLKKMLMICALGIPLSLIFMSKAYADPNVAAELNSPLAGFFSIAIFSLAAITLIIITWNIFTNRRDKISGFLIVLLCAIPFIWQIDASVYVWQFATAEGYPAWIPITRILYAFFSFPLGVH